MDATQIRIAWYFCTRVLNFIGSSCPRIQKIVVRVLYRTNAEKKIVLACMPKQNDPCHAISHRIMVSVFFFGKNFNAHKKKLPTLRKNAYHRMTEMNARPWMRMYIWILLVVAVE